MDQLIIKFSNELQKMLADESKLIESSGESINVKEFDQREILISTLNSALSSVAEIESKILTVLNKARHIHTQNIQSVTNLLRKRDIAINESSLKPVIKKSSVINQDGIYTKVKFTEAISLPAISVMTFDKVQQDGELYYIEPNNHFAFKLGGIMFHGNIGIIYSEEKNPEKVKDCKFATNCVKHEKCNYYHDPLKFPTSKDYRNFVANSFIYTPIDMRQKNRPVNRRIGSRDHLDMDVIGLQEDEVGRFNDQVMHDVLCALIVKQSRRIT